MQKLNKSSFSLVICASIHTVVSLFSNTFLVAYFLNISNATSNEVFANIPRVAIYYTIVYGSMAIFYTLFSFITKKTKRVGVYQIGVFMMCAFVFLVAFFKEYINQYYYFFALFYAFGNSLYWVSFNTLQSEVVSSKLTKKYFTVLNVCTTIINITLPIILGSTIQYSSFVNTAIYVFVLSAIQFVVSFTIKNDRAVRSKFVPMQYLKICKDKKYKPIRDQFVIQFLHSAKTIMPTLVTILTVMTFNSNLSLGILTSIFSALSIITLIIYTKYGVNRGNWVIILAGILPVVSIFGLIIHLSKVTLIIYNLVFTVCACIPNLIASSNRSGIARELSLYNYIVEHQALCEVILNSGRFLNYGTLALVALTGNEIIFKVFLIFIVIQILILSIAIYKLQNKLDKLDHTQYAISKENLKKLEDMPEISIIPADANNIISSQHESSDNTKQALTQEAAKSSQKNKIKKTTKSKKEVA